MAITTVNDDAFLDIIKMAVETRLKEVMNEQIEEAKKKLESEVSTMVASLSIQVMKMISMERMGNNLVISVKMDGFDEKT